MAGKAAKTTKIRALIERPGTVGEQTAAAAALERVGTRISTIPVNGPLSDSIVKRLPAPTKGNFIRWDTVVPGFGIRITAGGARSYVFDYRVRGTGRRRRYTIGSASNWTAGGARIQARELRRRVDGEEDPMGALEEARTAPTVVQLCDRFAAEHLSRKRPGTIKAYERTIEKHIRPHFGSHMKVADVAFADIDALHRKVTTGGGPYAGNRTIAIASKMFALSIRWNMRSDNPCRSIERNTETQRKRYLKDGELARLVQALAVHPDKQSANIIRLLLLTGARKGEVFSARWSDIDLTTGIWTKPASTTKQKADHVVPLSAPARQLLSEIRDQQIAKRQTKTLGEFVFPGRGDGDTGHVVDVQNFWEALCQKADIVGLRMHDLRHSFASQLASDGASLPLIGALLGHSQASTTQRYAHLFVDPQRAAAEKVGAAVVAAGAPVK